MKIILISLFGVVVSCFYCFADTPVKVCRLVTSSEIHEIVGITVGEGEEDSLTPGVYQCSWAAEGDNAQSSILISYQLAEADPVKTCSERFEGEKKLRKVEETSGFGKRAWWSFHQKDKNLSVLALNVCVANGVFRVSLWGMIDQLRDKKVVEELTRKSLSRL
jgi:hypothetical protein